MRTFRRDALWALLLAAVSVNGLEAYDIRATPVASIAPVDIRNAGDGSQRLFFVMQEGVVWTWSSGGFLPEPFLDISDRVADPPAPTDLDAEYNYGLLSVAFAPDFADNGVLYANYTADDGEQTISRFRVPAGAQSADPASEEIVLSFHPQHWSHLGGHLVFGPDGFLYISVGDGQLTSMANDDPQELDNLFGKILRIDVSASGSPYGIPPDNPFAGMQGAGVRPEIWAYGLRNPWRLAFDPLTGDLYIADVGEFDWEEINYQDARAGGGQNYGWPRMEGSHCHRDRPGCDPGDFAGPVMEYGHVGPEFGCAVVGGEVYRGSAYANLRGKYLLADYCRANLWTLSCSPAGCEVEYTTMPVRSVRTFGKSEDGGIFISTGDPSRTPAMTYRLSDGEPVAESGLELDTGFSGAWGDPTAPGQGFMVMVFPALRSAFAAQFTYEAAGAEPQPDAIIGHGGHRWLTAYGPFSGDTATLTIELTHGGTFLGPEPVQQDPGYGNLSLVFAPDCMNGTAHMVIPSAAVDRTFPIRRIIPANRLSCLRQTAQARIFK